MWPHLFAQGRKVQSLWGCITKKASRILEPGDADEIPGIPKWNHKTDSFFLQDCEDPNPLIRALAVRTMGCIRVDKITEYLCEPLRKCLKDEDPYVRKTAAVCVAKLHDINAQMVEDQGFLDSLRDLIADSNPMVGFSSSFGFSSLAMKIMETEWWHFNITRKIKLGVCVLVGAEKGIVYVSILSLSLAVVLMRFSIWCYESFPLRLSW